ncbi:tail fiber domain-containing protein [Ekhidna sp.]|uniref:tail fiber domain-containing protein n=1 Tax=Ekhidna sp. TaxID=2608089 RepID=UPI00351701CD
MIKRFFYIFSATLFIMLSSTTGVQAEVMEKHMEALERNLNSPPGFNYQAVLRNSDGSAMASSSVTLRFTVSNTSGNLWVETHSVTTDANGMVTAVIGAGTKTGGSAASFDVIDWGASDASLKVEVNSGSGFVSLGTNTLQSVPYAAYADNGISDAERDAIAAIPASIDDLADGSGNAALNGVFTANELAVSGAFSLPTTQGTIGQVLTAGGEGVTTWEDAAGSSYAGSGNYSFQVSGPTATPNNVYSNFGTIGGGRNNVIQLDGGGSYHSEDAVIGGGYGNTIQYSAAKAVIAGGSGNSIETYSDNAVISGGSSNYISESYNGAISGGYRNELNGAYYSAIGGGYENSIESNYGSISGGRGNGINSGSDYSTVGGGYSNTISFSSSSSTVAGGYGNYVRSQRASIGGGYQNQIADNSTNATIAGGYGNRVRETSANGTIAGGYSNSVRFGSNHGFIGGGRYNSVNASPYGVVAGGYENGVQTYSNNSAIGGGYSNGISSSYNATISGGYRNSVRDAQAGTVAGGRYNYVENSSSAFIGGGQGNRIGTSSYRGTQSSIVGGRDNTINAYWSTIGGGNGNTINEQVGVNPLNAAHNTIAGGKNNTIGGTYDTRDAFIGGGYQNVVNARSAATVGGWGLQTSSFGATAIGFYNATVGGTPSSSVATDALFVIGNGIDDANRSDAMVVTKDGNASLNGTWTAVAFNATSDRRLKEDITDLKDVLQTLTKLEGYKYKFNEIKSKDNETEHFGVIAQELREIYPNLVKEGEDGYLSVNYTGLIPLLLEAVKELNAQNQSLMAENDQLERANDDLEVRQSKDEARFADLESKLNKLMMLVAPVDMANND